MKIIGLLFNCMAHNNGYKYLETKSESANVQSKITVGSQFQCESKLDHEKIIQMNFI